MRMFIEWVNETYIPAGKRKALPEEKEEDKKGTDAAIKKNSAKFGRWVVANVSKWIHPDKNLDKPRAKQIEVGEVSVLVNAVVNQLKGLE